MQDMQDNAKCRKWSGFGRLWLLSSATFGTVHTTSYMTNRNYASILYHFRVITSYVWKVYDFNLPHCIWHPHWGWTHLNFAKIFGMRELDYLGYCVMLFVWF